MNSNNDTTPIGDTASGTSSAELIEAVHRLESPIGDVRNAANVIDLLVESYLTSMTELHGQRVVILDDAVVSAIIWSSYQITELVKHLEGAWERSNTLAFDLGTGGKS
ncbi:hypothetical protein SMD10_22230 [Consotaella sp. CSK11QG-6]